LNCPDLIWAKKGSMKRITGNDLDKDVLIRGNTLYSPATCIFITREVNRFFNDHAASRGEYLIGATWHKRDNKFIAACNNGKGKSVHLGCFDTEIEAHNAWRAYKHALACKLADEQTDPRVADVLRSYYATS